MKNATNGQMAERYSPKAKYLSDAQLAERYSVSRASIWRWSATGRIPRPVQISPGCTRWPAAEIDAYDALREARRNAAA